jgi:hypothetical protein
MSSNLSCSRSLSSSFSMPVPKPDIRMIRKTQNLRAKDIPFRAISVILADKKTGKPRDIKTLHRWSSYDLSSVGKLSTNKKRKVVASVGK